jgi:Zn-dependent M16 (insulinase) family peptidase
MWKTALVLAWGVLMHVLSQPTEAVWRQSSEPHSPSHPASLAMFHAGEVIAGFRVIAAYTNHAEDIVGLRLTHVPTGMPLHFLQMETVPQAAIMIRTVPQSDDGAAHALEHLLVGKGTKGRALQLLADMRLGKMTAGTTERFTWYHLYSGSGMASLLELLTHMLEGLFRPDFTDEEAQHEAYHVGVATDAQTGQRALIEQGTVYTEMSSHEGAYDEWYALLKLVLGAQHPLTFRAGGTPEAIRRLTPQAIREFHRAHYSLGPTTPLMIVVDRRQPPAQVLTELTQMLNSVMRTDAGTGPKTATTPRPSIQPAAHKTLQLVPVPSSHTTDPATILFAWTPVRLPSLEDRLLLEAFLRSIGQGSAAVLYRRLVDRQTRDIETGATGVGSLLLPTDDPEFPVSLLWIEGIQGDRVTHSTLSTIRTDIHATLHEVASYPDHAAELRELNRRVRADLIAQQRALAVWQASPPGFGQRRLDAAWMEHLERLEGATGLRKSLVLKAFWPKIVAALESGHNLWRGVIERAGLLEEPYGTASIPTPALRQRREREYQERMAATLGELRQSYHSADEQEAIRRFEADLAQRHEGRSGMAQQPERPTFTPHPPLTFDDTLPYVQLRMAGVPVMASYVAGTARADVGLAFDLTAVPARLYRYLPLLPGLIRSIGLREGHAVTTYHDFDERVQRDFYELNASYRTNPAANRYELVITASGMGVSEFMAALDAVQHITHHNDLHLDNLSRIDDLLAQYLHAEDVVTKQPEEDWIEALATAFRYRTNHLFLSLSAHPTRAHHLQRLRWLLAGPVAADTLQDLRKFTTILLTSLRTLSVAEIEQTFEHMQERGLKGQLVDYWRASLTELPPSIVGEGLQRLSDEVLNDLQVGKERAIQDLRELQAIILNRARMRLWLVGDRKVLTKAHRHVEALVRSFPWRTLQAKPLEGQPVVVHRLQQRHAAVVAGYPWYVGYVREDASTGNIVITAKGPDYRRLDPEALVEVLAAKLLAGTGPHTWYKKTWDAGLAYGNGLDVRPRDGTILYYADRCPSVRATLAFVRSLTQDISRVTDQSAIDYAFAQIFAFSRAAQSSTARSEAMATDLAERVTPVRIKRFSQALLRLRTDQRLLARIRQALPRVVAKVMPGSEDSMAKAAAQSLFFFIASESQLNAVETEIPGTPLYRLWPSDFWLEYGH